MPEARLTLQQPAQLLRIAQRGSGPTAALTLGPALPASSALLLLLAPMLKGSPGEPGPSAAAGITVTPAGGLTSANVQSALQELDGKKLNLTGGTLAGALNLGFFASGLNSNQLMFKPQTGIGIGFHVQPSGSALSVRSDITTAEHIWIRPNFIDFARGAGIRWTAAASEPGTTIDAGLFGEGGTNYTKSGVIAQRDGTSPQTFRLYNTYTDASNYERLGIGWSANTLTLNAEYAGTGVQRHIGLQTGGGRVGIGTAAPSSKLHIVAGAAAGLTVQTDTNQDLFNFLKQNGSSLWRGTWDGSNFHHYLTAGNLYYNLSGNIFSIDGNGNANSGFVITGGAKFRITTNIDGSSRGIVSGDNNYATSAVPLVANRLIEFGTWAWNGSNGYSIHAKTEMVQQQLSAVSGDARLYFKNVSLGTDLLSILTLSGNVGVGVTSPSEKLHVIGNIKSTGYSELSEITAPVAPATNDVRIYAEDNGAGKTRLMARFATGAAVQIAIEP